MVVTLSSEQAPGEVAQQALPAVLDLAHALAGDVDGLGDGLERHPAVVGEVERAAVLEVPRFEVGKRELDRAGRRDLQVEVVPAPSPRAGPRSTGAVSAG